MGKLDFQLEDWIGDSGSASELTLASLRMEADREPVTEVLDTIARTVREHINVPLHPIAQWLVANWWRLRWEPRRKTPEWRLAHSMASIGGGYAWPPVDFAGCGDFVLIHVAEEAAPDVAAVRYLRSAEVSVPGADFEAAVDQLVSQVQTRLSAFGKLDRDLEEVRLELDKERADPKLARLSRLQALAGIDPGSASQEWLDRATRLGETTGPCAIDEVMTVLPDLDDDLDRAKEEIDRIRKATTSVDLSWVGTAKPAAQPELPWQEGERLAAEVRLQLGLTTGPVPDQALSDRLQVKLPLPQSSAGPLRGGFRNGADKTAVLVKSSYLDNQRFFLARLIGCAYVASGKERLLPAIDSQTALQKFQRAFAQELLCPWTELDSFTEDMGMDDEAISAAAKHFGVSEMLVLTTLVNKKKMGRDLLGGF